MSFLNYYIEANTNISNLKFDFFITFFIFKGFYLELSKDQILELFLSKRKNISLKSRRN